MFYGERTSASCHIFNLDSALAEPLHHKGTRISYAGFLHFKYTTMSSFSISVGILRAFECFLYSDIFRCYHFNDMTIN